MKLKTGIIFIIIFFGFFINHKAALAQTVSLIGTPPTSVRVYEKYEVKFNVNTSSLYPFFQYDESPPTGVQPKIGVTVEGIFTTPSGKQLRQPGFYMTEVARSGSGDSMVFEETNKKYWVVRFSPQEVGNYQVSIHVKDAQQDVTAPVGNFNAATPAKKGFIKVSQSDPRYFEFSNGELYWPIGPAWSENHSANPGSRNFDYSQYKDTGQNLDRTWMGGSGAYSTNWARWMSSSEEHGNEGIMTSLNFDQHYPGHDLSYEIFYPDGYRIWISGSWVDSLFGPRLKAGATYQVKLTFKTANISGPSSRCPSCSYGFVVRAYTPDIMYESPDMSQFENALRNAPKIISHQMENHDWQIITTTFTNSTERKDIYLYLDNVTAGQVYIDEFSVREIQSDSSLGGELIRNPRADIHTYVEQRPAAYFDWQVEQGEQNGVFFKYVVHDKNDWIQNHLLSNGQFADDGDGYYQDENTKARWLLRQWYRYLAARWGYSTAVHSWELNNEGPPNEEGNGTAAHWRTAQAFAKFMHDNDAHPHLATTSFWCCWRPAFWGNKSLFPDVDYADIHEYTGNPQTVDGSYAYDMAGWIGEFGKVVFGDHVGKPTLLGEGGITSPGGWEGIGDLQKDNPGIWYHNLIWAGLHYGAVSAPNYWFSEHFRFINREEISKPFYLFVKDLDLNKGGYVDVAATVSNSQLRIFGQKNITKGKACIWIQNKDHTWKKVMDGSFSGRLNGTVTIAGFAANTSYPIEWWDFNPDGSLNKRTGNINSDSSGRIVLNLDNLSSSVTDTGVKIGDYSVGPTPTPTPSPICAGPGDVNCDQVVNSQDALAILQNWLSSSPNPSRADTNGDGKVNGVDFGWVIRNWL